MGVVIGDEPLEAIENRKPAQRYLVGLCRELLKSVGGYLVPRAGIEKYHRAWLLVY